MKKKRILIIILGLTISLGSVLALFKLTGNLEKKVPVVLITEELKPLEAFTSQNVQVVEIPTRYLVPHAVQSLKDVVGKRAAIPIYPGEQLLADKISQSKTALTTEERYLSISTNGVLMKPGQKVDIYLAYDPGKSSYQGVEKILADKVVAAAVDEMGRDIYNGKAETEGQQAAIEIIVTQEEIVSYLEKERYAKETIVKQGGVIQ